MVICRGGGIRTRDDEHPKLVHYQAVRLPEEGGFLAHGMGRGSEAEGRGFERNCTESTEWTEYSDDHGAGPGGPSECTRDDEHPKLVHYQAVRLPEEGGFLAHGMGRGSEAEGRGFERNCTESTEWTEYSDDHGAGPGGPSECTRDDEHPKLVHYQAVRLPEEGGFLAHGMRRGSEAEGRGFERNCTESATHPVELTSVPEPRSGRPATLPE
jgi:hypothetical protein